MNLFPTFSTKAKTHFRSDVFLPDKTRFWKICDALHFLLRQQSEQVSNLTSSDTIDDTTSHKQEKNEAALNSIINVVYDYQLHWTWTLKETNPIDTSSCSALPVKVVEEKGNESSQKAEEVEFCYIHWNRIYVPLSFYSSGFPFFQKWSVENVLVSSKNLGLQPPTSLQLVWRIVGKKHTPTTNEKSREEWWKQLSFLPRVCSVNKQDPLEITIVIRGRNETIVDLGHFWHYLVHNTQIFVEIDSCSVLFVTERKIKKSNSNEVPMSSLVAPSVNPFLHVCRFELQTGKKTEYELRKYDFSNYRFDLNSLLLVDQEFWLLASRQIFRFGTESGCFLSPPFSCNLQEGAIQILLPLYIQDKSSTQHKKKSDAKNQVKEEFAQTWKKEKEREKEKGSNSTLYLNEGYESTRKRGSSAGKERSTARKTQGQRHQSPRARRKSVDYRVAAGLVFSRLDLPTAVQYRYVHTGKEIESEVEAEDQEPDFERICFSF